MGFEGSFRVSIFVVEGFAYFDKDFYAKAIKFFIAKCKALSIMYYFGIAYFVVWLCLAYVGGDV